MPAILDPLTDIVNLSLTSGHFPSAWRRAHLLPLSKRFPLESLGQTRPIALLPEISKVLERAVHDQLSSHLEANGLLDPMQAGFRRGHSTQTALLKLLEDARTAIDTRKITALLLFDFSKAFDVVSHKLLLTKLRKLNCDDTVITWFASYLSGRSHAVVDEDGSTSQWLPVNAGVPQGSVLGPLLFSIFIKDLPDVLKLAKHVLFADDLQIYHSFLPSDLEAEVARLNSEVQSIVDWSKSNDLLLNCSKTQAIFIGSEQFIRRIDPERTPKISVDNAIIPYSSVVKTLGIWIDSTLDWTRQTNSIVSRIHGSLRTLRHHRHALNFQVRQHLVEALIFPILDYCCAVYDDLFDTLNKRLQTALNACVRFVFGNLNRREHITPYRIKLGWLSVSNRRKLFISSLAFNVISHNSPAYLSSRFLRVNVDVHVRSSSRLPNKILTYPTPRTSALKYSFTHTASDLINSFPSPLPPFDPMNKASFRRSMKNLLVARECEEWHNRATTLGLLAHS